MVPEGIFWYHHLAIGHNHVLDVFRYLIFWLAIVDEYCCHSSVSSLLVSLFAICYLFAPSWAVFFSCGGGSSRKRNPVYWRTAGPSGGACHILLWGFPEGNLRTCLV